MPDDPMITDSTPLAEGEWYYLNRSRQVGPYSLSELRSLLAKNVISPATLVWERGNGGWCAFRYMLGEPLKATYKDPRDWLVVAVGIAVFLVGLTISPNPPLQTEMAYVFANLPKANDRPKLLAAGRNYMQIPISEIATREVWRNSSFSTAGFVFNSVRPSLTSHASPATVPPAEGQLVQEFWRSIASSNIVDRYEFYLRRFPSGEFAEIAAARIKELRKITKQVSVNRADSTAAKRKRDSSSSKTTKSKTLVKTTAVRTSNQEMAGRCRDKNIGRCGGRQSKRDSASGGANFHLAQ